ncbi:phospholipase C, phosphocholine-specific [Verrucomicrobium sp. BvORR106]|uniref:phosphocholine-specific phospholipase C n=1 Tax=Verrucomicrobium sp. BvORR106 TaxID=1403819 RepID=UPI00056E7A1C|nr:phospholipase C, phosphocholine-specific [Verrucomicrobium sp. BvORR106]
MQTRRAFIQRAATLAGGLGSFSLPDSLLKALSIEPAEGSTFADAEHVVILMQENRSFDHVYGTLRGVRGFDDPRAVETPGGNPVWLQTDRQGKTYAPFGLNIHETKSTWMRDLPHDRMSQVAATNKGKHDQWLYEKRSRVKDYADMPLTLGYYDRRDVPFYYAFADAFTVCDQHFSSIQSCTTPNRLFLWTGTNRDPRDPSAEVRVENYQIDHDSSADWPTFPERLEEQGISWKFYQNELYIPTGLDHEAEPWLCNFGDNPLEYFSQYHLRFHPARMTFVRKRAEELRGLLAAAMEMPPPPSPEEAAKAEKLAARRRAELAKLEAEIAQYTPEGYAALTPKQRSLHERAFVTNTADPQHREMETLRYREGEEEREVKVPAGDVLFQFRKDVTEGKLPAVSWLAAPEVFSDHPSAPWYGAWYVSEVLDILTQNPEVWKKTVFILTYDENDGYYDHVPTFVPPHTEQPATGAASKGMDTTLEFDDLGHAIGLGYRVPMVIASPWSRGGNVCSQVFDHTSVLQFLEVFVHNMSGKTITETNISPWRRAICGDLTSAFRKLPEDGAANPEALKRDGVVEQIHRSQYKGLPESFRSLSAEEIEEVRSKPTESLLLARQEKGQRASCALPYELKADGRVDRKAGTFEVTFEAGNQTFGPKAAGAAFQVFAPGNYGPEEDPALGETEPPFEKGRRWSFAVSAGDRVSYAWKLSAFEFEQYHLRAYGPNGFYREFRGALDGPAVEVGFDAERSGGDGGRQAGKPTGRGVLQAVNRESSREMKVRLTHHVGAEAASEYALAPGQGVRMVLDFAASDRWYDFSVTVEGVEGFSRRYAGRIENGEPGLSDPAIGRGRGGEASNVV